jgi:carbonic anhydrase
MPYLNRLIEGYHRFREKDWEHERERWSELAEGQSPRVMILSCADSRVDPAQIFDARPGEMFVVRNIAALAPPYETSRGFHGVSAALEFAVTQLKVSEILVMGHGLCGGCAAALTGQFDETEPG